MKSAKEELLAIIFLRNTIEVKAYFDEEARKAK
jgi:hypothetical protein